MPIEITMPRLSDTMESGTVIKWNVGEGDEVSSGDAIADVETDKATMEMQVYDDGTIASILVKEGQAVDVGTVIAVLAEEGEDLDEVKSGAGKATKKAAAGADEEEKDEAGDETATAVAEPRDDEEEEKGGDGEEDRAESEKPKTIATPQRKTPAPAPPTSANGESARLFITPVARRMADEHGIDVKSINGSGPQGRIIKRDVQRAIEQGEAGEPQRARAAAATAPELAPPAVAFEPGDRPLNNMRQTIAKRLVQSKTTIPHYQVTFTFNMDPLLDLRKTLNTQLEAQGVKLSVNDFLVRACALAILQHPEFNAVWGEDHITVKPDINIGVAVALPRERGGGLIVATIRNADRKGLRQISDETRALADKARTRGLTVEEMADSTFTLSNLGMYGVEHFTAIINPPNAAILAVGGATEKPVVRDGQIVIGREIQATLSLDHRIIDGAMAAEYLQTLKQMIENPATLLV